MFFYDDLEFVRNLYARNNLKNPFTPTEVDDYVGFESVVEEFIAPDKSKVERLKRLARVGRNETSIYTPGYVTKSGKKIRGYFRTVKAK